MWLANRGRLSLALISPVIFAWVAIAITVEHRLVWPRLGIAFLVEIAGGALIGHLIARWAIAWFRHHGLRKCSHCFRPGRWSIQITIAAPDWAMLPTPAIFKSGCFCDQHVAQHLIDASAEPMYDAVAVVPYHR
jgi:hypothetical protein